MQNGDLVWDRGFGYQDVETFVAATARTPYPIADLTQTFAAVLLMQCYQRGTLELSDSLSRWSAEAGDLAVGRVLSHTAGVNGPAFKYDPARFALLTSAVDRCGQTPARTRVVQSVFTELGMIDSVPGRDLADPSAELRQSFDQAELERYQAVLARLATPYKVDRRGRATRSELPDKKIDASTGVVSSVRDLALYDRALDEQRLLRPDAMSAMWSNVTVAGTARPTGLGWFVQTYNGEKVVWHFGYAPDAFSSLIVKIPARHLTLILLANSDGLSAPFNLADGDISASPFAVAFLRLFI